MADEDLRSFIERIDGDDHLRVEQDLGHGFVKLRSSEAERRQAAQDIRSSEDVVLELLRNSRDAHARHIFIATQQEAGKRHLAVIDDGVGIPAAMTQRVFEARVTSKLENAHPDRWGFHGRGMALYSVAYRAETAQVHATGPDLGTVISVVIDQKKLGEKADQSTFPHLVAEGSDQLALRGPKNIQRVACEFALEYADQCRIYCGSAVEVAATLYRLGLRLTSPKARASGKERERVSLMLRPCFAVDAAELARWCAELALDISERSARRIMDGTIEPLKPLDALLQSRWNEENAPDERRQTASARLHHGLRLDPVDRDRLIEASNQWIDELGRRYYFHRRDEAGVRISRDALIITIPLEPD